MEVLNVFIILITILILLGLGFVLLISYILAKTKTAKNKPIQKASNKYIDAHKLLLETMEVAGDTITSGYSRDI